MSLIPSESHSFPDNYSPVARCWRKANEASFSRSPAKRTDGTALSPLPTSKKANGSDLPPLTRTIINFLTVTEEAVEPKALPPEHFEKSSAPVPDEMVEPEIPTLPAPTEEAEVNLPPPRLKIVPRRPRPVAPISPEDADPNLLLTANGHGRARQFRPRTPNRVAKPVPANRSVNLPDKIDGGTAAQTVGTRKVESLDEAEIRPTNSRPSEPVLQPSVEQLRFNDDQPELEPFFREQRRSKLIRFVVLEFFATAVLVPSAWLVLSGRITDPTIVVLMNILTIAAAAAAVIVPIFLFALAPALPRHKR
jgi:hypothetical protein